MVQVIVKTYDKTLSKYEFENKDLQEVIWRLETLTEESADTELPETFQEQSQGLKDELLNIITIIGDTLHINRLLDWMQKKLDRK